MIIQKSFIMIDPSCNINYPVNISSELLSATIKTLVDNLKAEAIDHRLSQRRIDIKGYKSLDVLNALGKGGWELVTINSHQYWLVYRG